MTTVRAPQLSAAGVHLWSSVGSLKMWVTVSGSVLENTMTARILQHLDIIDCVCPTASRVEH